MNLKQFVKDTLNKGGASFNLVTGEYNPNFGYMVATSKNTEIKIKIDRFSNYEVAKFIKDHALILCGNLISSNKFLGSWVHEGYVYLDISTLEINLNVASLLGLEADQLAIFCNKTKSAISLNNSKICFNTLSKEQAEKLYLDYANNFLSVDRFAEYYSLHLWQANKIINTKGFTI